MKILLLVMLIPCWLVAQEISSIQTDRPDQTETAYLTPKGWVQAEFGFLSEKTNEGKKYKTFPSVLWKYGLLKNFELRLITEIAKDHTEIGIVPVTVGFKVHLFEQKGLLPHTALIVHTSAARLASPEFQTEKWEPSFRFVSINSLGKDWALSYNYGAEWDSFAQKPIWLYTVSVSHPISKSMGAYAELYGYWNPKLAPADHRSDAGVTYLVNPNFQIDLSAGLGIQNSALNRYASLGISYRLDTKKGRILR